MKKTSKDLNSPKKKKKSINSMQQRSSRGESVAVCREFQCRLELAHVPYSPASFPAPPYATLSRLSTSLVIAGTSRVSRVAATRRSCLCRKITNSPPFASPLRIHPLLSRSLQFDRTSNSRQDRGSQPEWTARRSSGVWGCWRSSRLARTDYESCTRAIRCVEQRNHLSTLSLSLSLSRHGFRCSLGLYRLDSSV